MGSSAAGAVGARAEAHACKFLQANGLHLVTRNFRRRGGEIDLVMLDDRELVFVEVRYRSSTGFARPSLTVDIHKQRKLIRTAALFVAAKPRLAESAMRFDVVAVESGRPPRCEWIRDAFRPGDSSL